MAVQSVQRTFRLLEELAAAGTSLTISELTQRAQLPMPTVHRFLQSLIEGGYVRQNSAKRYALGPRMIRLGDAASRNLGAWSVPYLARLVEEFGETANLAMLEGSRCVYVGQVPSPQRVRMFTLVGNVVPLHNTGVGKALLSTLSDERAREALETAGMPKVTPNTITTVPAMFAALAEIRERGYAIDDEEQELGVRCVAVAVEGLPFPVAVSVSGPSSRVGVDAPARMAPSLRRAAADLVLAFGDGDPS